MEMDTYYHTCHCMFMSQQLRDVVKERVWLIFLPAANMTATSYSLTTSKHMRVCTLLYMCVHHTQVHG